MTYSPSNVKPYGTLVLRSSNIQNGKLAFDDNVYVDMELPKRVIVKENDILICVRNGSRQLIGKCALIDKKTAGNAFGAFMSIYRSEFSNYVFHQFQSHIIQRQINETLGATINQITNKDFASFQIPVPIKAEQDSIVTVLSDTNSLISSLEKLIAKKKAIKQGAMQELLKPKEGWEVKKLGDYLDYEQPTQYIVSDTEYNDNNETPVLTAGKTFILGFTNEEFGIYRNIPVIIFDDFTTAIKFVDFPFKVKSSAMKILKPKNEKVNLRFVYEIMQQIEYPMGVGDHKRHWIGEYQHIEIKVPSPHEQTNIAVILSDMDAEIDILGKKLEKYKKIKQGMMQNLLTGKIRLI